MTFSWFIGLDTGESLFSDLGRRCSLTISASITRQAGAVNERPREICLPLLMVHGEVDRLNATEGGRRFFEQVTFEDKTLTIYPGGFHEPHNDLDHDQVTQDLVDWLIERL